VTGSAPHCGAAVWDLIIRWSKSRRLVGRRSQHPYRAESPAVVLGATQSPTPYSSHGSAARPTAAEVPGYPRETDSAASYSFAVCARVPSATYVRCRRRLWRPRCRGNTLNVSWRRTPRERSVCRHVGCCSPAAWWMPKKAKRSATYPERPEASCANTGLSGRSGGRPGDRGASSPRQRTESSQRTPVSEQDPVCPDTRSNDE
jgi:hypothetical protein